MRLHEIEQLNELRYAQLVGPEGIINKLIKSDSLESMNQVMQDLEGKEVKQIGAVKGNYAVAYRGIGDQQKETGHAVLKVSKHVQSDWQALDQFLKISKSKPPNPLFPRVYMYQIKPDNSFWVLLEYLTIQDRQFNRKLLDDTFGVTKARGEGNREITLGPSEVAREIKDILLGNLTKSGFKSIEDIKDNKYTKRTPQQKQNFDLLVDFISQIVQKGTNVKFDLLPQNIGQRSNGQIVFFDAIA